MCTLIALHRCMPGVPLVVAANRDEYLDRPAEGLAVRATASGPVLAPRDLRAGGTWLALGSRGRFAALTNRPLPRPDPQRRSRGLLVLDALAHDSARAAARAVAATVAGTYNPFNLLLADSSEAFVVTYDVEARVVALSPGVHVIGNADPEDGEVEKVSRLRERVEGIVRSGSEPLLDALAEVCRDHGQAPLDGACVHAGEYGTRSSTLLRLGDGAGELRHAAGPPCRTPYRDFSSLLRELAHAGPLAEGGTMARKAS